jgi:hypothetical protein
VAPIFGTTPLYIKKDKKWQMPLIMRPELKPLDVNATKLKVNKKYSCLYLT